LNRVSVLLLIFILASSPAMVASTFAEPLISEDFESQTTLNGNYQKSGVGERHSIIKISVVEEIGIDRSVGPTDQKQNQQKSTITRTNHLHLRAFDSIGLSDGDRKNLDAVKQSSDRKASMERIWNAERIRFDGKNLVETSMLENSQTIFGAPFEFNLSDKNAEHLVNQLNYDNTVYATPFEKLGLIIAPSQNGLVHLVSQEFATNENEISHGKNLDQNLIATLLLSAPFVGIVFVSSEKRNSRQIQSWFSLNLKSSNVKKIFVYSIILLLISQPFTQYAFALQTALPNFTNTSSQWTFAGTATSHHDALRVSNGDTSYTESDLQALAILDVRLEPLSDPTSSTGHVLRFEAFTPNGGGGGPSRTETMDICLFPRGSATQIACSGDFDISRTGYTSHSYTLTDTEADSITDYSLLDLVVQVKRVASDESITVTFASFEVPDAENTGPPVVTINTPSNNQNFLVGQNIAFDATALDPDEGDLTSGFC